MASLLLEKIKNFIKLQILYSRLLFSTEACPMKPILEVRLENKNNSDTQKLEIDITTLAFHKAINLGLNVVDYKDVNEMIHAIQIKENCQPCFKNKPDCSESRCCWMKLCFKEI